MDEYCLYPSCDCHSTSMGCPHGLAEPEPYKNIAGQVTIQGCYGTDSHYKKLKIEPIDYARENNLDVYESKVIKYVSRAPFKGKQLDDLEKARNILDMLIEKVKQGYMPLRGRNASN